MTNGYDYAQEYASYIAPYGILGPAPYTPPPSSKTTARSGGTPPPSSNYVGATGIEAAEAAYRGAYPGTHRKASEVSGWGREIGSYLTDAWKAFLKAMTAGPKYTYERDTGWRQVEEPKPEPTPYTWRIPGSWEALEEEEAREARIRYASQVAGRPYSYVPKMWEPTPEWEVARALEQNIRAFGQEYMDKTQITLPYGFTDPVWHLSAEKQLEKLQGRMNWIDWATRNDTAVFNRQTGERLSWQEAVELARTNPDLPATQVFVLGEGSSVSLEKILGEQSLPISYVMGLIPPAKLQLLMQKEMEAEPGRAWATPTESVIAEQQATVRAEEQRREKEAEIAYRNAMRRGRAVQQALAKAKTPDVNALSEALRPYGISVLSDYPWISPTSEAHLMTIPDDVLKKMRQYLERRGLAWSDFLAISESFYGGGEPTRGSWAIPRQWG